MALSDAEMFEAIANDRIAQDQRTQNPTPEDLATMKRRGKVLLSAIPRILTAPFELVNSVGQIGNAIAPVEGNAAAEPNADGSSKGFMERLGDASYTAEGLKRLRERAAQHEDPEAWLKSEEGKRAKQDAMPTMRRYTERAGNAIDDLIGAPRDDEKTTDEKVVTGVLQALTPGLPLNVLSGAGKLAKGARVAADLALPGTSGYTAGNVALNAGVSAGSIAAIDAAVGGGPDESDTAAYNERVANGHVQPLAVKDETIGDDIASSDKAGVQAATLPSMVLGVGLMAGLAALNPRAMGKAAADAQDDVLRRAAKGSRTVVQGGDSFVPKDVPTSKPGAASLDELAPVQKMLDRAYENDTTAMRMMNEFTIDRRINVSQSVDMWRNDGHLEGLSKPSVSGNMLREAADMLDQRGMRGDYNLYAFAKTAMDTRNNKRAYIESELQDIAQGIDAATSKAKWAEVEKLGKQFTELQLEHQKILADDKATRPSMQGLSNEDIAKLVADGEQNPIFRQVDQLNRKLYADAREFTVNSGMLSKAEADAVFKANPNYLPLVDDKFHNTKGLERFAQKLRAKANWNENPFGDDPELVHSFSPHKSRNTSGEAPVNNPIDFADAGDLYMERLIRYGARQRFSRNIVDATLAGPNAAKEIQKFKYGETSNFSVKQVKHLIGEGVNFDNMVPVKRGDKVEFYTFTDPLVPLAMRQNPVVSLPLWREMSAAFRNFTTGKFNPGFAPMANLLDVRTINATRPMGSVFGFDGVVQRAMYGFGINTPEALLKGIRVASTNYDPVAVASSLWYAGRSFAQQNGVAIANKISQDLRTDQGFFAAIAKAPGGEQFLQRFADNVHDAFNKSWYGMAVHSHVASAAALENIGQNFREMDKLFNLRVPRVVQVIGSPATLLVNQMRYMMSSIHSAARVSYVYQNMGAAAMKYGGADKIPDDVAKRIFTDARVLAGDIARKPGSKALQVVDSAFPYTNIMLRTQQTLWQRLSKDPKLAALAVSGAIMPKVYSDWLMSNSGREAYNWYWRDMPEWERESSMVFPSAKLISAWMDGKTLPFSPDNYYKMRILPEFMPFAAAVSAGVRGLAMYGDIGMAQKDTVSGLSVDNVRKSIAEGMAAAFAPMTPPIVGAMGAYAGVDVDTGNLFKEGTPFRNQNFDQSRTSRAGLNKTINTGSDVPKVVGAVIGKLFGTMGTTLVEAYDTGVQVTNNTMKDGKDMSTAVLDGVLGAGKEVVQRTTNIREGVPLLVSSADRVYARTPTTEHTQKMRDAINMVAGPQTAIKGPVNDTVLDAVTNQIKMMVKHDQEYGMFSKRYAELAEKTRRNDANKMVDYSTRMAEKNKLMRQRQALDQSQLLVLERMQKQVAKGPIGQLYQTKFGEPFSFDEYKTHMQRAYRKSQTAPKQSGSQG